MSDQIKVGQIWREVDPRFDRYVRVLEVTDAQRGIMVRTVYRTGTGAPTSPHEWLFANRSRASWCDRERFNGKRGGYELAEDVP
jgi:hypothetical protein